MLRAGLVEADLTFAQVELRGVQERGQDSHDRVRACGLEGAKRAVHPGHRVGGEIVVLGNGPVDQHLHVARLLQLLDEGVAAERGAIPDNPRRSVSSDKRQEPLQLVIAENGDVALETGGIDGRVPGPLHELALQADDLRVQDDKDVERSRPAGSTGNVGARTLDGNQHPFPAEFPDNLVNRRPCQPQFSHQLMTGREFLTRRIQSTRDFFSDSPFCILGLGHGRRIGRSRSAYQQFSARSCP